jgi:hypothetical protein
VTGFFRRYVDNIVKYVEYAKQAHPTDGVMTGTSTSLIMHLFP